MILGFASKKSEDFKSQWLQAFHLRKPLKMLHIFSNLGVSACKLWEDDFGQKWKISRTGTASIQTHHTTTANMKTQMKMTGLWRMTSNHDQRANGGFAKARSTRIPACSLQMGTSSFRQKHPQTLEKVFVWALWVFWVRRCLAINHTKPKNVHHWACSIAQNLRIEVFELEVAENLGSWRTVAAISTFWDRKRAEYGFGEYGFKHRTQWVFRGSLSSGDRTQWVPLSLLFVCQSELTEFWAELTEFAVKLSEFSSPKQYSRNSIPLPFPMGGYFE